MNTPKRDGRRLVQVLADLFAEAEPNTPEEIDEILRDAGYDPDEVATRGARAAAELMEGER